jgi:hypothetical protein
MISEEETSPRDGIWVPCCESVRRAVRFTVLMLQMYSIKMACKQRHHCARLILLTERDVPGCATYSDVLFMYYTLLRGLACDPCHALWEKEGEEQRTGQVACAREAFVDSDDGKREKREIDLASQQILAPLRLLLVYAC